MTSLLLLLLALAGTVAWTLRAPVLQAWRRWRIRSRPFPAEWRAILRQQVPYVRTLPADLQLQLKKHMQLFLAEKPIIGCRGLQVSDEMRLSIAAQACLLLLNRRSSGFEDLSQILVYPGPFVVQRTQTDSAGLVHEGQDVRSGESWSQGQVVLSWDDVQRGAAAPGDGHNVVIHEMAHQLDAEDGSMNGTPRLRGRARRQRWAAVMEAAFGDLQQRVAREEPGLIDAYGASNRAEFFAVVSELFFERPQALSDEHPALFAELRGYYQLNPLSW
ncbi:MAG: zinc-dependent peptidase [Rubrivivax sp.]|nr:zinc-dependent peptidase [Rubrivivax sp.]